MLCDLDTLIDSCIYKLCEPSIKTVESSVNSMTIKFSDTLHVQLTWLQIKYHCSIYIISYFLDCFKTRSIVSLEYHICKMCLRGCNEANIICIHNMINIFIINITTSITIRSFICQSFM